MGLFLLIIGIILLVVGFKMKFFKGVKSVNELGEQSPGTLVKGGVKAWLKIAFIWAGFVFTMFGLVLSCIGF